MRKRNKDFGLSSDEVVAEYMKTTNSHHKHHHHHSHSHSRSRHSSVCEKSTSSYSQKSGFSSQTSKKNPISVIFRILIIIIVLLFLVAIIGVSVVLVMRSKGKNDVLNNKNNVVIQTVDDAVAFDDSGKTVEYKGQKYVYNDDIITAVFLGIDDKRHTVNTTSDYGKSGQADTIMVLAYDTKKGNVSIVNIPRDSMVDVDVYSSSGDFARTEKMQVCLSFAYGDGGKSSCENVVKSIERILMGVPIDYYFSLRVRGIAKLNDAVGGIELTSLETINQFKKGEKVWLSGEEARHYCLVRDQSKIDSDAMRRKRQIQYIKAYAAKVLDLAKKDISIVTKLYNTARQYSVTDITLPSAVYVAGELLSSSAKFNNVTSLRGEYIDTQTYPQYILNDESVYETILETFYNMV